MSLSRIIVYCTTVMLLVGCSAESDNTDAPGALQTPVIANDVTTEVTTPAPDIVTQLDLDTGFYNQHLDVDGLAIVTSENVSPYALLEARWSIRKMLVNRPDLITAIASTNTRLVIMSVDEFTTDVPEHADLTPANFWDRRSRGLGSTEARPAVSVGEENVLQLPGDPYDTESILVHEFAHTIHQQGLNTVDSSFNGTLTSYYRQALDEGLWQGTYAATNPAEYFAEGVQSWFGTNRENDNEHNEINTREELIAYDIRLAGLLEQVFGDNPWQYQGPGSRLNERDHLAGFDVNQAGEFVWPDRLANVDITNGPGGDSDLPQLPNVVEEDWSNIVSPSSSNATSIHFLNNTSETVSVRWVNFSGQRIEDNSGVTLTAGTHGTINSFEGHLFEVFAADQETVIARFRADAEDSVATID